MKLSKEESSVSGKLRTFFLVSLLLLLLSCQGAKEVKISPREFFLKKYREGVYRFKVINNEPVNNKECEVELKDLIKGEKYRMKLKTRYYIEVSQSPENVSCELLSRGRYLEVAGDKFTPPSGFRIVQNIPLRDKLYLWVYEKVEKRAGGGGIFFIPWGVGGFDYDYGRYRTIPPYGGK